MFAVLVLVDELFVKMFFTTSMVLLLSDSIDMTQVFITLAI